MRSSTLALLAPVLLSLVALAPSAGCAKGFNALKLSVVERIVWAWILTIPASALAAYALVQLARSTGWLR